MHLHILGIAGTFMSALAILAREAGFEVTGSDRACYPPVSDLLRDKGIAWTEGYDETSTALKADTVIVGNAIKRGMPVIEAVLNAGKPYTSGPQWLAEHILSRYQVIAIAGTHGKTTTTSMTAHILDYAGLEPGFLIGGVASNFQTSARLGKGKWFVIEADEYDSAFFDKRPKFMHYRPNLTVINNLEFDHADIYADLTAIKQQFRYFLRTIPSEGRVIAPRDDEAIRDVLAHSNFCHHESLTLHGEADWQAKLLDTVGQRFAVYHREEKIAEVNWPLIGQFNVENALAAFALSVHAGVRPEVAADALQHFLPVKRRLEVTFNQNDITLYDDFAHHPTAIRKTIEALTQSQRHQRVIAVLEFGSYTMRSGVHADRMADALKGVDYAYSLTPQDFSLTGTLAQANFPYQELPTVEAIIDALTETVQPGDAIVVMSNRGFDNIHQRLSHAIAKKHSQR